MDGTEIGPLQLIAVGFGPDATFEGLVLDELERLTARGLIRVIDLRFVTRSLEGDVTVLELDVMDEEEAALYGAVIDRLVGVAGGAASRAAEGGTVGGGAVGLDPARLVSLVADLEPGHAAGLLLVEHTWAAELTAAIRTTGGYPIAQGFLTPESVLMVGAEVQAIAEAEAAIELADAVAGAAMLDAVEAVAMAQDVAAAAAVQAVRSLMVAGLVVDAAADEALEALVAAELVEVAAIEAAAEVAEAALAEGRAAAMDEDDPTT